MTLIDKDELLKEIDKLEPKIIAIDDDDSISQHYMWSVIKHLVEEIERVRLY